MWQKYDSIWHECDIISPKCDILSLKCHIVSQKKYDIMSQKNVPPMNLPFCWYVFVLIAWFDIYYFFIELGELFYIVVSLEKRKKKNFFAPLLSIFFSIGLKIIFSKKFRCGESNAQNTFWLFI